MSYSLLQKNIDSDPLMVFMMKSNGNNDYYEKNKHIVEEYILENIPSTPLPKIEFINRFRAKFESIMHEEIEPYMFMLNHPYRHVHHDALSALKWHDYYDLCVKLGIPIDLNYYMNFNAQNIIDNYNGHYRIYGNIKLYDICNNKKEYLEFAKEFYNHFKQFVDTYEFKNKSKNPLVAACNQNHTNIIQFLCKNVLDMKCISEVFHNAIIRNDINTMRHLVNNGYTITTRNVDTLCVLNKLQKVETAEFLLNELKEPIKDLTKLTFICQFSIIEFIKVFYAHGAKFDDDCMICAISENRIEIVKFLLEIGIQFNKERAINEANNNQEIIKLFG